MSTQYDVLITVSMTHDRHVCTEHLSALFFLLSANINWFGRENRGNNQFYSSGHGRDNLFKLESVTEITSLRIGINGSTIPRLKEAPVLDQRSSHRSPQNIPKPWHLLGTNGANFIKNNVNYSLSTPWFGTWSSVMVKPAVDGNNRG